MKNKIVPLPKDERLRFVLVYQGGSANVFQVDCFNMCPFGRNAKRVYYGSFRTAENIAYGAGIAGAIVTTAACNQAGDITNATWGDDLTEQPFSGDFRPVYFTLGDGGNQG